MQRLHHFFKSFVRLKSSFYLVILLIQVLLIVISVIFTKVAVKLLKDHEESKADDVVRFVSASMAQETDRAEIALLSITRDQRLKEIFAERDRAKLLATLQPVWGDMAALGFKQLSFYLPQPTLIFFLRLHSPAKYGDEVPPYRATVLRCDQQKTLVKGLEQGKAGYGFRALAPLMLEDKHLGTIEIGSDFGDTFLSRLNQNYNGHWAIYNLARGVSDVNDQSLLAAIGPEKDRFFPSILPPENILAKVRAGGSFFALRSTTETGEIYIPVKNFQNDIVGFVMHVYPTAYYRELRAIIITAGSICFAGLLLSGLIIAVLYRLITVPIRKLVGENDKIKQFQLDEPVTINAGLAELRELVEATRSMKIGLQSFQKYVPAQLVRQLIQTNQEARVSGLRRNLTVYFSDIADFTSISQRLTPKELAAQLSDYLNEFTEIVIQRQGTVDKYIGDAIMAFWNAPLDVPRHASEACAAALDCQRKGAELGRRWAQEGKPPFVTRIGLHTGDIVVGNIGSAQRLNYTVIGDAVNLASRLEGLNKVYGTQIIISQDTYDRVRDEFEVRLLDFVTVKGRTEAVTIYELVAEKGEVTSSDLEFLRYFNEGVLAYKQRDWDRAMRIFAKSLDRRPADEASKMFSERCRQFQITPPDEDWTGEHIFATK